MRLICLLLLGSLPTLSSAKPARECQELKSEQIRLALIASNLANQNTTRTPEGGPYHPFKITSCQDGGCQAQPQANSVIKYLPGHPDANKGGYVALPDIDVRAEFDAFNMTATKLRLLASAGLCRGVALIEKGPSSFMLRYQGKGEADVKEDLFNLSDDHQVVGWMRQDLKGHATTIRFREDGTLLTHVSE